jgi:hypothetical protein
VSCASWSSSLPVPLLGPRGRKRARTPERSIRLGRGHRAGGVTPVGTGPQSKPVTPASRLVAQVAPSVASGLGPRILAAGPARDRLYSYRGRLCEPDLKACSGRPGAQASPNCLQRPGPSATELARRGMIDRDRDPRRPRSQETSIPGDRIVNWDIRSLAIEAHHPQALRSDDETRDRHPPAQRRAATTASGPAAGRDRRARSAGRS